MFIGILPACQVCQVRVARFYVRKKRQDVSVPVGISRSRVQGDAPLSSFGRSVGPHSLIQQLLELLELCSLT